MHTPLHLCLPRGPRKQNSLLNCHCVLHPSGLQNTESDPNNAFPRGHVWPQPASQHRVPSLRQQDPPAADPPAPRPLPAAGPAPRPGRFALRRLQPPLGPSSCQRKLSEPPTNFKHPPSPHKFSTTLSAVFGMVRPQAGWGQWIVLSGTEFGVRGTCTPNTEQKQLLGCWKQSSCVDVVGVALALNKGHSRH